MSLFDTLKYLKSGNEKQRNAFKVLTNGQIFEKLNRYSPVLIGTIPINIDIETSDLDIACHFIDVDEFIDVVNTCFKWEANFKISTKHDIDTTTVVANFFTDGFEIEIFGQNKPVKEQFGYRHMLIENHLLNLYGEVFRQQIIDLKRKGYKTEPAFAMVLGITGNPYVGLLKFEENFKL